VNGTVFAVSPNDGTSAVVVQASTSALTELARARIGLGSTGGTNMTMYDGALDDKYFTNASTGSLLVCGTGATDTSPWLYTFGFTGTTLNTTPTSPPVPIVTSTRARCSPLSEFFNPNVNPGLGGTDFFFFGLTIDCFGAATRGCVWVRQSVGGLPVPVLETGGVSGIVIDNQTTPGSDIYFTTLGGATGRAVQLTQNGLQ